MVKRGKLIVLESIEAAGKGTATDYMRDEFRARKTPVVFTREIGGTPYAESIREIMLHIDPTVPSVSGLNVRRNISRTQRNQTSFGCARPDDPFRHQATCQHGTDAKFPCSKGNCVRQIRNQ